MSKVSVILLARGCGIRINHLVPKHFLFLKDKVIGRYSFDLFKTIPMIFEIIVVCDSQYRSLFRSCKFADPGQERQDSVWNGFQHLSPESEFVAIHDSARHFLTRSLVIELIEQATIHPGVASAVRVKSTIKQASSDGFVIQTLDRSTLWETDTPKIITPQRLREGLSIARSKQLVLTDDMAALELLEYPVKLIPGSYQNIKITTPEELLIEHSFLS